MVHAMRVLAVVVLVALLVPVAAAAPASGTLATAGVHTFEGRLGLAATLAVVNLTLILEEGGDVGLAWTSASAHVPQHAFTARETATPFGYRLVEPDRVNDTFAWAQGGIVDVSCLDGCVALLVVGEGATARVDSWPSGPLTWTTDAAYHWNGMRGEDAEDSFRAHVPSGALTADVGGLVAEGRLVLMLDNVIVRIRNGSAEETLRIETTSRPVVADGVPVVSQTNPFLVIDAQDATLALAEDVPVRIDAWAGELHVDGAIAFERATGVVRVGEREVPVRDESLRMEGDLTLHGALARGEAAVATVQLLETGGFDGRVSGDVDRVTVGGAVVAAPRDAAAVGTVALGAGVLLLAALAVGGKLLFPLYSRISRSRVLANENRARILDIVKARPGVTTADLAREAGLARVVVQHHLRMLEAHRLVVARAPGRARGYFAAVAGEIARHGDAAIVLNDETRRRIAVALATSPAGATQKALAESTGVPRRLVAYHLQKLEETGLATTSGVQPKRYHATPLLAQLQTGAAA